MPLFFAALFVASACVAAPQSFVSGPARTHLLELFTSQGCSSCPPAEAWLSRLANDPALWRTVVPVAWHVDYWDRLGWKDRFASKAATARQYAYAAQWRAESVYTPCFAIDGAESRDRQLPDTRDRPGRLSVSYTDGQVMVRFEPTAPGEYEVHGVLLALGITSQVTAGENAGRALHHDVIATGAPRDAALHDDVATFEIGRPPADTAPRHALAVWITRRHELTPLQATGGMLTP
jgi:hypothetical protein